MARKQVLVQLDDELVTQLDREAKRSKISRSELIRHALNRWFEAREIARLERRYEEGYRRMPETAEELAVTEALARRAAEDWPPYETG
jgi:metal-responsive CopG/Arc/MetJ family transcriptional regulator